MVKKNHRGLYRGERCVVTDLRADNVHVWVVNVRNASGRRVDLRKNYGALRLHVTKARSHCWHGDHF